MSASKPAGAQGNGGGPEMGAVELAARLEAMGAAPRILSPADVTVMLAEAAKEPFSDPGWLFELKYDGVRALLGCDARGEPAIRYRSGRDATETFPELVQALRESPYGPGLVLDAEVVALDEAGRPSFPDVQKRVQLQRHRDIEAAAVERPLFAYVFDLLGVAGRDLRAVPLAARKELLREVLPTAGPLRFADHVEAEGAALFARVREMGLEGVMAKRSASTYRAGRWSDWLKITADLAGDFAVVGYSRPKGTRTGFGALLLAVFEGGGLVYAGRVGSGFEERTLASASAILAANRRATAPCNGPDPAHPDRFPDRSGSGPSSFEWVEPTLVAEVRFKNWSESRVLRIPVFVRFRDDKQPTECVRVGRVPGEPGRCSDEAPAPVTAPADARRVRVSNPAKILWPAEGYTKLDLVEYYEIISPWLLPYLHDRLLALTRYPDGIEGKSFFQRNTPDFVPPWVRRERIWSEHAQREVDLLVVDDADALRYVANLASIPLHVVANRADSPDTPDFCVLDLDPSPGPPPAGGPRPEVQRGGRWGVPPGRHPATPFEHVVGAARAIRRLCVEVGLPCFVKTSGSTGLHVYLPLHRQLTYEQSQLLAKLLAGIVAGELPETTTVERSLERRLGRVYIDTLQNAAGKVVVAPFSVRPLPGAPVSTPLRWEEVKGGLDPASFTIRTVPGRVAADGDPMRPLLDTAPDMAEVLERLERRVTGRAKGEGSG